MIGDGVGRRVNDPVHDITSGTWAAGLVVIWLLRSRVAGVPAEAAVALADVMWLMLWLQLASLVLVLGTGALRLRYYPRQVAEGAEDPGARRRAALVRHVLYLVVYGGGTLWAWYLVGAADALARRG